MLKGVFFDFGDTLITETDISTPMLSAELHIVDGIERALEELSKHYTLAVVSNTYDADDSVVTAALARVELDRFFLTVVTSVTAGHAKPDERIYHEALDRVDLSAHEVVMVGDRLDTDVLGANRAGILSVFHRWNDRYDPSAIPDELRGVPDATIKHLDELSSTIHSLGIGDAK